ncbi:sigma factor-like helix-turn-helix DNA-binding protein [Streptomyces sp. AF1A]|jgi:RNA polymerase sigma-70 factor (ECF subfamily)|uniref:sigma factor-like helix-turn-helix DNA-binding protein n=1 Tax=Streptomyces sp. AF1A TaxID=3394350 RepID=UPI0039BD3024
MDDPDAVPIADLVDERRYLLDLAQWMLGGAEAAESVVDETYRRWYGLPDAERRRIAPVRSWLARTAGAICLGRLASPGPDAAAPSVDPGTPPDAAEPARTTLVQEVRLVLLNALDSLSPAERAAFVLNDVFGMPSDAVADMVGRPQPECAELADRARRSLRRQRSLPTTPQEHDALARAVLQACVDEDTEQLTELLAADATAFFDGGGKVRALTRPVHGDRQVAHSLLTLLSGRPRTSLANHPVNGRTGLVARYDRQVAAVIGLDIRDHRVSQVWIILNPYKLHLWNRPSAPAEPGSPPLPAPREAHRSEQKEA